MFRVLCGQTHRQTDTTKTIPASRGFSATAVRGVTRSRWQDSYKHSCKITRHQADAASMMMIIHSRRTSRSSRRWNQNVTRSPQLTWNLGYHHFSLHQGFRRSLPSSILIRRCTDMIHKTAQLWVLRCPACVKPASTTVFLRIFIYTCYNIYTCYRYWFHYWFSL